jgi:hypothetical protein
LGEMCFDGCGSLSPVTSFPIVELAGDRWIKKGGNGEKTEEIESHWVSQDRKLFLSAYRPDARCLMNGPVERYLAIGCRQSDRSSELL